MAPRVSIARTNAILFAGTIVNRLALLVLFSLIARNLGSEYLGDFYLLITLSSIFTIVSSFGFDILTVRETAADPSAFRWYYPNVTVMKGMLSGISILASIVYVALQHRSTDFLLAGIVSSFITLFSSNMSHTEAVLRGEERFLAVGMMQVLHGFVALAVGMLVLTFSSSLILMMSALLLSYALTSVVSNVLIIRTHGFPRPTWNYEKWATVFRDAYPFVITSGLSILLYRLDILLLSSLGSNEAVGWYGSASRIVENYGMIPGIIVSSVFPMLSRQHKESANSMIATSSETMRVLLIIGVPLSLFSMVDADKIIRLFFGNGFHESVLPFQVLCVRAFSYFITTLLGHLLFAANQQKRYVNFIMVVVGINVVLNIVLIPTLGHLGPAFAVVGSTLIGIYFHIHYVRKLLFNVPIMKHIWKPFLISFPMLAYVAWSPWNIFVDGCVSVVLFSVPAIWVGLITNADRAKLKAALFPSNRVQGGDRSEGAA